MMGGKSNEMFEQRRTAVGFDPGKNRGWIKIGIPAQNRVAIEFADSSFGEAHTEEKLIGIATGTYHVNLDVAPDASAENGPRILELYTEREPCAPENTDEARKTRIHSNCRDYLQKVLHAKVIVSFSVPNNNTSVGKFLAKQSLESLVMSEAPLLINYAVTIYKKLHRERFGFLPTSGSEGDFRRDFLKDHYPRFYGRLSSEVTDDTNRYNEAVKAITTNTFVLCQLDIDEIVQEYVYEHILAPDTPPSSPRHQYL